MTYHLLMCWVSRWLMLNYQVDHYRPRSTVTVRRLEHFEFRLQLQRRCHLNTRNFTASNVCNMGSHKLMPLLLLFLFHIVIIFFFFLTKLSLLLQAGKVTFSYIYGIGVLGCLAFYCLLSLMATNVNVTLASVISVLGYCLLPMVVLSGVNVLITIQ